MVGIDIGSAYLKAAILTDDKVIKLEPVKISGKALEKTKELFQLIKEFLKVDKVKIGLTGSGAENIAKLLGLDAANEVEAITAAINKFNPDVRHIIEIGAETQKYISLFKKPDSDKLFLEDVIPGGKCAGGTGSFLEYMHKRLKYDSLDDFIKVGLSVEQPAGISGRCAVFAESDIVHHYQKGTPKEKIVAGIHQAAARNYRALIHKGKFPKDKTAFIGGVSLNDCIKFYLKKELELKDDQLIVPEHSLYMSAIGCALMAKKEMAVDDVLQIIENQLTVPFRYETVEKIKLNDSILMEDSTEEISLKEIELAGLGVDIGSVSTKAALITKVNDQYKLLASYYRRTEGNPIEAVKDTLSHIHQQVKEKGYNISKITSATTGSGRYLTGYFIGADCIKDEITSQASGTNAFIKEKDLTVIELGGQDSKFIQLKDGCITDFEMNWACAAGTGALIEKHAKNLNIEITEFGGHALQGEQPPMINSTCAVFAESALLFYQQNNVNINNLCAGACLASANNYLIKVVRSRPISEKVAFQGAVAFNKGMVGSFETVLKKPIIVPPYPHLTGAVGCAKIAYEEMENNAGESKFRSFETILQAPYELTSFQCKTCNNECLVNKFEVNKEVFFQGDRCDRYSSIHKKSFGENLPDLFAEREKLLLSTVNQEADQTRKTVAIPRGLFFSEYYPLFGTFFKELGFNVIASGQTNKRIIKKGIENVVAEPCFPIKVSHGHVAEVIEKKPDYIFFPAVLSTEQPTGRFQQCVTCPYVQSAPDVILSALNLKNQQEIKLLTPSFFLERGYPHILRVFTEVGKDLGKTKSEVKQALDKALTVQKEFREKIKAKGKEILAEIDQTNQRAFVVIGRPYALHDAAINMDIGKKIRDEGYLAIPFDFLPVEEEDVSDSWPNIYSIQGQKKLAAGRLIKKNKNLQALVLTYFGCGPDAFLDQMFKEELGMHYLTAQIDEHTSDTGILTRIQAHLNTARVSDNGAAKKVVRTHERLLPEIPEKTVWIPYMSEASHVLVAALNAYGINAKVLPHSGDAGLNLARKYICGDVCTPMLFTTEDMLYRAGQDDFNPQKEAFFQGKSGGPCRYGMYYMVEKLILNDLHEDVDIVTICNRKNDGGLGTYFLLTAWDTMLSYDLLEKMYFHTRPYEKNKGDTEEIFLKYVKKICQAIKEPQNIVNSMGKGIRAFLGLNLFYLQSILQQAQHEFTKVPVKDETRPLVGVVGEFFVRLNEPANQYIIRKLEESGAEVWLAPMTEFFGYSNYITGMIAYDKWKDEKKTSYLTEALFRRLLNWTCVRHEHQLFAATLPYMEKFEEIAPKEVVTLGSGYVNKFFGGEAILSLGKSEDFARKKLSGIVSVGPFNCMPSLIVSALSRELRRKNNNIPYLNIDYDGFVDTSRDQRITMFMSQVKQQA